jgi:hypothetical protein
MLWLKYRAALQCINRRLRQVGGALGNGKFRTLQPSSKTLFTSLQLLATACKASIDGLRLQGIRMGNNVAGVDQ